MIAKLIWVIIFLTGIGAFGYFGQDLVFSYLEYNSSTDIEV